MNDPKIKKQIIDNIKDSANVLVALSASPSVDALSAALGLTLAINKLDKHATAIFSGDIPAAIEFLEPEKTFENNVSSLQDFIIALDKEKADHLRYKVEGDAVKIFITPYRTTISQDDLEFSQGDFNVDFVVAIGVKSSDDLDAALRSHGQILDGTTVASLSLNDTGVGTINWNDKNASSFCEMAAGLVKDLKGEDPLLDEQIATALLTGIVAATDRFSNAKTSSRVMTIAADLMSAGANQQLISVQLGKGGEVGNESQPEQSGLPTEEPVAPVSHAGELSISHELSGSLDEVAAQVAEDHQEQSAQVAQDALSEQLGGQAVPDLPPLQDTMSYMETPMAGTPGPDEPALGGTLNATTEQAAQDAATQANDMQNHTILSHDSGHYLDGQPNYNAPISAAVDTNADEPEVRDIFADNAQAATTADVPGIPAPALPPIDPQALVSQPADERVLPEIPGFNPPATEGPTLADIDAQNRGHQAALDDVHAALSGQLPQVNPAAPGDLPPLPPIPQLPPMPDFSTLPPVPGMPDPGAPVMGMVPPIAGSPLGATLPPATVSGPTASDPAQFKIPGQQ